MHPRSVDATVPRDGAIGAHHVLGLGEFVQWAGPGRSSAASNTQGEGLCRFWKRLWHSKHLYLFLIPTFTLLLIFSYYPPISAIYNSFFQWDGFSKRVFIGLQNFRELFTDKVFLASWKNLFIPTRL